MGTVKELKKYMKSDEELRTMLVRSGRHEVLIDLDGDKVADIALVDNNEDGDIDMIAVDVTGNGDFNLYIGDDDVSFRVREKEMACLRNSRYRTNQ